MTTTTVVEQIPLTSIHADDTFNSRGQIVPGSVAELAKDIKENGLTQPVTVRRLENGELHLVAGFRRFMAHRLLKLETIKAIILEGVSDLQARIINLSENLNRADLSPMQESRALQHLEDSGMSEPEICKKLGRSRGWVQTRLMLLRMPKEVQELVEEGDITLQNVRQLYSITDEEEVIKKAKKIKEVREFGHEGKIIIKVPRDKTKRNRATMARTRNKTQILALLKHIDDSGIPFGLHTRCLSWAAGEINDIELAEDLLEFCDEQGIEYEIPSRGFPDQ